MSRRLPVMPIWVADLMSDRSVQAMTHEELGMYMRLLFCEWLDGPIPEADVTALLGVQSVPKRVSAKFKKRRGWWTNERLESERERLLGKYERRASAGRLGAEKRWSQEVAERPAKRRTPARGNGNTNGNAIGNATNLPMANGIANDGKSYPNQETTTSLPSTPAVSREEEVADLDQGDRDGGERQAGRNPGGEGAPSAEPRIAQEVLERIRRDLPEVSKRVGETALVRELSRRNGQGYLWLGALIDVCVDPNARNPVQLAAWRVEQAQNVSPVAILRAKAALSGESRRVAVRVATPEEIAAVEAAQAEARRRTGERLARIKRVHLELGCSMSEAAEIVERETSDEAASRS